MATKPKPSEKNWNSLKLFHKLILINSLTPQNTVLAIGCFIQGTLGKRFTDVAGNSSLASL